MATVAPPKKPFNIRVGERIKNARTGMGLSRPKFAAMINISHKFLYDVEVGNKGISSTTLRNILKVVNTSADALLRE